MNIREGSLCDSCEYEYLFPDCDGAESSVQVDGEVKECGAYDGDLESEEE